MRFFFPLLALGCSDADIRDKPATDARLEQGTRVGTFDPLVEWSKESLAPLLLVIAGCADPAPGEKAVPVDSATTGCASGSVLDGTVCVPEACGAGTWGELVRGSGSVFVDGTAAAGGDGTESAPFVTVQEGVDRAVARGGGSVLLAAGTYRENVVLGDGGEDVDIVGRCPDLVTIDGSGDDAPAVLAESANRRTRLGVSGLTVTGGYGGIAVVGATASVTSIRASGNRVVGVWIYDGAEVSLADVEVTGTEAVRGQYGRGLDVELGAVVLAERVRISGNVEIGVYVANDGTEVSLVDGEVLGTVPSADGSDGRGVEVVDGATLTLDRTVVVGNTDIGVSVADRGTTATLLDSEVRDTNPMDDGTYGCGISVQGGAELHAERVLVQANAEAGISVTSDGTAVTLLDVSVTETRPTGSGAYGRGVDVSGGAGVAAERLRVDDNADVGVYAGGAGTTVTLTDAEITGTRSIPDGSGGRGIDAEGGATVAVEGTVVTANADIGIFAAGDGSSVTLLDTEIRDTLPRGDGNRGRGLAAQDGATIRAERVAILGSHELGVWGSHPGTRLTLTDVEVRGTLPDADGSFGRGIHVTDGAALSGEGLTVDGNTEVGIAATAIGTDLELTDSEVSGTVPSTTQFFAIGIGAQEAAVARLTDVTVADNAGPGLYSVLSGSITCQGCAIERNDYANVFVGDASTTLSGSTVLDGGPDASLGGGIGVYADGRFGETTLLVSDSTIGPHPYAALWVAGDGDYEVLDNDLSGSGGILLGTVAAHGNAVFGVAGVRPWDGATGLLLDGNRFHGSEQVAVLLHDASTLFGDNTWDGNVEDVVQQHCGAQPPLDAAAFPADLSVTICDGADRLIDVALEFSGLYMTEAEAEG